MRLTAKSVQRLRPRGIRYWVDDDALAGFRVAVFPSGVKSFAVRLRSRGGRKNRRDSTHVIGRAGTITAEQAREKARELLSRATLGEDVAGGKREARSAPSVSELARQFLHEREGKLKPTTLREYDRILAVEIIPALGSKPAVEVTRREVAQLHHSARARPYMANRILAVLGSLFSWAAKHGYIPEEVRPTSGVEQFREQSRERYLTDTETVRLGNALREAERVGLPLHPQRARYLAKQRKTGTPRLTLRPANPFAVAAIRFLLLTGWREGEALTLRWEMIDVDNGRARLPDTKAGLSWRDLGGAALHLLRGIERVEGSPFVFPGARGDAPMASLQGVWFAVRHAAKLGDVRLHDLRHNYASQGAQHGTPLQILAAVLGHREIETTRKYSHLGESPVRKAADDISASIAARLDGRESSPLRFSQSAK